MKKFKLFILLLLSFVTLKAQNGYVYRLYNITAKNHDNKVLVNARDVPVLVALKFGSKDALASYTESQNVNTNSKGKFSLTIGKGEQVGGQLWDQLPWNNSKIFANVRTEGNDIGTFEVKKEKDYSSMNNKTAKVVKPPIKQNTVGVSGHNQILKKVTVGGKEISAGDGVVFMGEPNRFTVSSPQKRITFETDGNILVTGTYPHYKLSLKKHTVGEEYLGGKIIKVSDDGQHGTVAKVIDGVNGFNGDFYTWTTFETHESNVGKISYKYSAFKKLNLWGGSGKVNTLIMQVNDNRENYLDVGETYSVTEIIRLGYKDWYLPSLWELEDFYELNKKTGFFNKELNLSKGHIFWTSAEDLHGDKIWKGHNDGPDGGALTGNDYPGKVSNDLYFDIPSLSPGFRGITGAYALNFYTGKSVTVSKHHWERVILFRDF